MNEDIDEIEVVEKHILLLLGSDRKPTLSALHLQKEMFLLGNAYPGLGKVFSFRKHYEGPFSDLIHDSSESPMYYEDCFKRTGGRVVLSEQGRRQFQTLVGDSNQKYRDVILAMKFIRSLYDRMTDDELLLIIYSQFPDYTKRSKVWKGIIQDYVTKKKLADSLLSKGIITKEKHQELLER